MMSHEELKTQQEVTLARPKMRAGIPARVLFALMDVVYGRTATLSKFLVLEVVARMPYVAWEQVSYVAITHASADPTFAKDIHENVEESREQQDNETWHLLILEEIIHKKKHKRDVIRLRILPQILAYMYYHISWLLFVVKPKWSYKLNAEFEDHAEHEYMKYVVDHPEVDDEKWESALKDTYGDYDMFGDVLRRIALDEREHMLKSLEHIENARFKPRKKKN